MTERQPIAASLAELQADLLVRLSRADSDTDWLRRLTTMLGRARDEGHVCIDLAAVLDEPPEVDAPPRPSLEGLRAQLAATGVVTVVEGDDGDASDDGDGSSGHEPKPLVLDRDHRLYTRRHFTIERRIARFVRHRMRQPDRGSAEALRAALAELGMLPEPESGEVDWQLAAVVAAARRSLAVLCGGPGTGKTTTVARLLAVLLHEQPELRVAIAAPTGKAAARLAEALHQRADSMPGVAAALAALDPRTLHRLLGYLPKEDQFRYGRDRKLPYDLVVVDEVSMVDPAIFAVLCDALADDCRLLLVGDQDQLAAVAAGQVLGDLCAAADPQAGPGAELAALIERATGMQVDAQPDAAPIANATVLLQKNHRFGKQPGIGAFALALLHRRPDDALASCEAGHEDLRLLADGDAALAAFVPHLQQLMAAAESGDARRALDAIRGARILAAQRHGPNGATAWNERVEAWFRARGHRTDEPYYVGRPVLVTSNDHQNRVFNGDLGVVGRNDRGEPVVWLADADGEPRSLHPRRLPAHETAWAMTVHKAQGSEFDHVLLALPDRAGPLNQAALIYTGVTRARRSALLCADRELLREGLGHWPKRRSGLAQSLRS